MIQREVGTSGGHQWGLPVATSGDFLVAMDRCTIEEGAFALAHQLLTIALPVEALAAQHSPEHLSGAEGIPISHPPEGKW